MRLWEVLLPGCLDTVDLHNVAAVAVVISVDGLEMSLLFVVVSNSYYCLLRFLLVAGLRTFEHTVSRKSRKHCFHGTHSVITTPTGSLGKRPGS